MLCYTMFTLNVIIKRAVFVTVSLQQLECIVIAKVFKLNQRVLTKSTKATQSITHNLKDNQQNITNQ